MTTAANKIVTAAAKSIGSGQYAELVVRMQRPEKMSLATASSYLRLRAARIERAYKAAGLKIEKLKLVLGTVKGKDTLTLTVNYQR